MSTRLVPTTIQSLAFGSIGATYMGIGARFSNSARIVVVTNLTDDLLVFSFDGVNDHFHLPVYTTLTLTITWNDDPDEPFSLPALSRLYVKETFTPSQGSVYVTEFRGDNDA